jgi:phage-related protein
MAVTLDTDSTYKLVKDNCSFNPSLRVNELPFGDGYDQVSQDGLNTEIDEWDLSFRLLPLENATTLYEILRASKASTASVLAWTMPGRSVEQYWRAKTIKMAPSTGVNWKVTCTLKRVNILG